MKIRKILLTSIKSFQIFTKMGFPPLFYKEVYNLLFQLNCCKKIMFLYG